jgi:hypothetical protein
VAAAEACNAALNIVQCNGTATVHDACGCVVIGNETNPQAVSAANNAWTDCESMGCCGPMAHPITPLTCGKCPGTTATGHCDPATSLCTYGP